MREVKRSRRHGNGNVQTKTRSSSDGEDVVGNRQHRRRKEGRRSGGTTRVIILMSMVVFVIVLLLVSDGAGCDMRRSGLGQAPHNFTISPVENTISGGAQTIVRESARQREEGRKDKVGTCNAGGGDGPS